MRGVTAEAEVTGRAPWVFCGKAERATSCSTATRAPSPHCDACARQPGSSAWGLLLRRFERCPSRPLWGQGSSCLRFRPVSTHGSPTIQAAAGAGLNNRPRRFAGRARPCGSLTLGRGRADPAADTRCCSKAGFPAKLCAGASRCDPARCQVLQHHRGRGAVTPGQSWGARRSSAAVRHRRVVLDQLAGPHCSVPKEPSAP